MAVCAELEHAGTKVLEFSDGEAESLDAVSELLTTEQDPND